MQVLKKIFGFIWAMWGVFWFMVVIIPFTLLYAVILLLFGKKYSMFCVWINCRLLCPVLLTIWGIRMKIFGKEKLDKNKTYVFVANHTTQVDVLACASAVHRPIRFLAKSELKYFPVFGYMVKMLGIMVDRKSRESREKSYRYMTESLRKGECLFLYPEGTRNRTSAPLKDFKDGAFKVAILAQVPIAVQTLVDARKVNNPKGIQLLPGTIELHYSDPIETKGMTEDDLPRLKEMVRNEMLKHLNV